MGLLSSTETSWSEEEELAEEELSKRAPSRSESAWYERGKSGAETRAGAGAGGQTGQTGDRCGVAGLPANSRTGLPVDKDRGVDDPTGLPRGEKGAAGLPGRVVAEVGLPTEDDGVTRLPDDEGTVIAGDEFASETKGRRRF